MKRVRNKLLGSVSEIALEGWQQRKRVSLELADSIIKHIIQGQPFYHSIAVFPFRQIPGHRGFRDVFEEPSALRVGPRSNVFFIPK